MPTTRKSTSSRSNNGSKAAPASTPQKLPVTTFQAGRLSVLSLLTATYTQKGSLLVGLDDLEPDEREPFEKFIEYAGKPLSGNGKVDRSRILRVTVTEEKETGMPALKNISGFAACKDGDKIVLTLGANAWEVIQKVTETGSIFRVGKLSSTLSFNSPQEGESLSASFSWRVRDEAAGQIFEWSDAVVWLQREEDGLAATTKQDLQGVVADGDPLLPLLAPKIVSPEPVWKLCYPDGDDSQPPLEFPLEYNVVGVSIKTYPNSTGGPSRVVHLDGAPYESVAVRGNAADVVAGLVAKGQTAFEIGTFKLQILGVELKREASGVKHLTKHQILRGQAIEFEPEDEDGEEGYEYEDEDTAAAELESAEDADEEDSGVEETEDGETEEDEDYEEEGESNTDSEEDYEDEEE